MNEIVIGTGNAGKLKEFSDLFADLELEVRSLADFPETEEPIEDGATFRENAIIKARGYAKQLERYVLADDSGLSVDFLDGEPGIFSARYAGKNATDQENINKLLGNLENVGDPDRTARFVCAIAISDPSGEIRFEAQGTCEGRIAHKPFGINGFGYDPVFIPENFDDSFGVLDNETKKSLSHRAIAARKINALLRNNSKKPT